MPQAWQVRECERQELLQGLIRLAYEEEETSGDPNFFLELGQAILEALRPDLREVMNFGRAEEFFATRVLPEIFKFSRSDTERYALVAQFLEKHVLVTGLNQIYSALQKEEFEHPERIYRAESASSEVPLKRK